MKLYKISLLAILLTVLTTFSTLSAEASTPYRSNYYIKQGIQRPFGPPPATYRNKRYKFIPIPRSYYILNRSRDKLHRYSIWYGKHGDIRYVTHMPTLFTDCK